MTKQLIIVFSSILFLHFISAGQTIQSDSMTKYIAVIDCLKHNDTIKKELKRELSYFQIFPRFNYLVDYGKVTNWFKDDGIYFKGDTNKVDFKLSVTKENLRKLSTTKKANYLLTFAGEYKNCILVECRRYKEKWVKNHDYSTDPNDWSSHFTLLFIFDSTKIIDIKTAHVTIM